MKLSGKMSVIVKQLKRERDRAEHQMTQINAALAAFVNVYRKPSKARRLRKPMSASARRRIGAAQRRRWAKVRRTAKA